MNKYSHEKMFIIIIIAIITIFIEPQILTL